MSSKHVMLHASVAWSTKKDADVKRLPPQ